MKAFLYAEAQSFNTFAELFDISFVILHQNIYTCKKNVFYEICQLFVGFSSIELLLTMSVGAIFQYIGIYICVCDEMT